MRVSFVLLFFLLTATNLFASDNLGVIRVAVADVRASSSPLAAELDYDPEQETQLLYGEPVRIVAKSGGWLKVEAMEQKEFSHNKLWQGYPGWIKKDQVARVRHIPKSIFAVTKKIARLYRTHDTLSLYQPLSMGTKLTGTKWVKYGFRRIKTPQGGSAWILASDIRILGPLKDGDARNMIVQSASQLLGDPYFWGGRSAHIPELYGQRTAVDCSGLANLAYRVAGIDIPRDSLEQYMKSKKIRKEELKTGDLIFSAPKDNPDNVSHVAIFIDTNTVIEAPKTGEFVRKIEIEKKYGVPFDRIREGKPAGGRILYFGTYLK
jgi:cell wall-associated NlpC family hydrolase